MRPQRFQGRIRPKVSSMPRQRSEAAAYLDIYKLAIEKERLEQELEALDQRRAQIQERLGVLSGRVADLEKTAHTAHTIQPSSTARSGPFDTLFLEY